MIFSWSQIDKVAVLQLAVEVVLVMLQLAVQIEGAVKKVKLWGVLLQLQGVQMILMWESLTEDDGDD